MSTSASFHQEAARNSAQASRGLAARNWVKRRGRPALRSAKSQVTLSSIKPPGRRRSIHNLIEGYRSLRALIPTYPPDKQLTRRETVKLATMYIQDLKDLLKDIDDGKAKACEDTVLHSPEELDKRSDSCLSLSSRNALVGPH